MINKKTDVNVTRHVWFSNRKLPRWDLQSVFRLVKEFQLRCNFRTSTSATPKLYKVRNFIDIDCACTATGPFYRSLLAKRRRSIFFSVSLARHAMWDTDKNRHFLEKYLKKPGKQDATRLIIISKDFYHKHALLMACTWQSLEKILAASLCK